MSIRKVILVRHTESSEDIDPSLHNVADDRSISLTPRGKTQARKLGKTLTNRVSICGSVGVYLSPTRRAIETWNILSRYFPRPDLIEVEPSIRNLDWGNVTLNNRAEIEAERYKAGVLNYQFPGGDNCVEYVTAIDNFVKRITADRNNQQFPECLLIVTHGFALRVILRTLLHLSDQDFRWLRNPPNGYCLELEYDREKDLFVTSTPLIRMNPI